MAHQRVSYPSVQFHEVDARSWMIVNSRIEDNKEWAIVHDLHNQTWEVWANGKLHGVCDSHSQADQRMNGIIQDYLEDPSRW